MERIELNDDFPSGFYEEFARLIIAFGRLEYLIKLCIKDFRGAICPTCNGSTASIRSRTNLCHKLLHKFHGAITSRYFRRLRVLAKPFGTCARLWTMIWSRNVLALQIDSQLFERQGAKTGIDNSS